jgi:hypothetical protein
MSRKEVLDSKDRPNMTKFDKYIKFGNKTYELPNDDYNIIKRLINKHVSHRGKGWTEMVPYLIKYFDLIEEEKENNKGKDTRGWLNKPLIDLFNYVDNEMQSFNKYEKIDNRDKRAALIMEKYPFLKLSELEEKLANSESAGREERSLSRPRYNQMKYTSPKNDYCDPNCPDPEGNGCCDRVTRILSSIFPTTFRNTTKLKRVGGKTKSKNKKHNSTRCKNRKNKKSCKNHK